MQPRSLVRRSSRPMRNPSFLPRQRTTVATISPAYSPCAVTAVRAMAGDSLRMISDRRADRGQELGFAGGFDHHPGEEDRLRSCPLESSGARRRTGRVAIQKLDRSAESEQAGRRRREHNGCESRETVSSFFMRLSPIASCISFARGGQALESSQLQASAYSGRSAPSGRSSAAHSGSVSSRPPSW